MKIVSTDGNPVQFGPTGPIGRNWVAVPLSPEMRALVEQVNAGIASGDLSLGYDPVTHRVVEIGEVPSP